MKLHYSLLTVVITLAGIQEMPLLAGGPERCAPRTEKMDRSIPSSTEAKQRYLSKMLSTERYIYNDILKKIDTSIPVQYAAGYMEETYETTLKDGSKFSCTNIPKKYMTDADIREPFAGPYCEISGFGIINRGGRASEDLLMLLKGIHQKQCRDKEMQRLSKQQEFRKHTIDNIFRDFAGSSL